MDFYETLADHELLSLLKESDNHAFEAIYCRYWAVLFRHARRNVPNQEEAKDVIQDIFTMLWTKRADLVIHTSLSAFLYKAVRHKILDLIDKGKVREDYLTSLTTYLENNSFYSTVEILNDRDLLNLIEREIQFLPPKMREVFELSRKHQLSHFEIGKKMNITNNTVKKQINNAIKILKLKFGVIILSISMTLIK